MPHGDRPVHPVFPLEVLPVVRSHQRRRLCAYRPSALWTPDHVREPLYGFISHLRALSTGRPNVNQLFRMRYDSPAASRPTYAHPRRDRSGSSGLPPHCLKKNGTSCWTQVSRMSLAQSASIGLAPGPDSPPVITQSIPFTSRLGRVTPAVAQEKGTWSERPWLSAWSTRSNHLSDSTLTPIQMLWRPVQLSVQLAYTPGPFREYLKGMSVTPGS